MAQDAHRTNPEAAQIRQTAGVEGHNKVGKFSKFEYHKRMRSLPPTEYKVLGVVWDYADENGEDVFPGARLLADETGMSQRTIERVLPRLVEQGWLVKVKPGGRSGDGKSWATKYRLSTRHEWRDDNGLSPPSGVLSPPPVSPQPATGDGVIDHLTDHLRTDHAQPSSSETDYEAMLNQECPF